MEAMLRMIARLAQNTSNIDEVGRAFDRTIDREGGSSASRVLNQMPCNGL